MRDLPRAAVVVALLAPIAAADRPAPTPPPITWSGTWSTGWGDMTLVQSGGSVDGRYPHDDGHVAGTVNGNVLSARWDEAPRKSDGDRGPAIFTLSSDGRSFSGKWAYDRAPTQFRPDWSGTCKAGPCLKNNAPVAPTYGGSTYGGATYGAADDVVWPPLPDAKVPLRLVANGCGGGDATTAQRYGDDSEFVDTEVPFADEVKHQVARYFVSFRKACDIHDAGYSGAKTEDSVNGFKVEDFFFKTKAEVDQRFLADMLRACDEQIPEKAKVARANCKSYGGYHAAHGARTRYQVVDKGGWVFWKDRPALSGTWTGVAGSTWSISHNGRSVTAIWTGRNPDVRSEFRGTLISHDSWSTVEGFYVVRDKGKARGQPQPMAMRWEPGTKNDLNVSMFGTLKR